MDSADDDRRWVAAARRGDPRAFEELYERSREWVASLALRFTGNREDALDVLQETYLYLFRRIPTLELECRLKTFLYPVVKHLSLTRKSASRRPAPPLPPPPSPPTGSDLEALVALLPEPQQEVVRLRFVDGFELAEIARALEVPLGTVKSRLHAALEFLRSRASNR